MTIASYGGCAALVGMHAYARIAAVAVVAQSSELNALSCECECDEVAVVFAVQVVMVVHAAAAHCTFNEMLELGVVHDSECMWALVVE